MKRAAVIAAILVVLAAVGLWMLQRAVDGRLARALPEASLRSGLPMTARGLGVNLWKGDGSVRDLVIGNPPGFPSQSLFTLTEGHLSLKYLPLLRGRVRFGDVTVKEANLTLVRLADGRMNVKRQSSKEAPAPAGRPAPTPETRPVEPSAARALPEMALEQLLATLTLTYLDYSTPADGKPFEALIHLNLTGSGLATYGDAADESAWGALKAEGYVESGGKRAPVQMSGRLAPLAQPSAPTFRMTGSVEKLDPEMIRPLLGKNSGIKGEAERLELTLVADKGRFDERQSRIVLTLKNVKLGDRVLETAVLRIPVHGTVEKPKLRLEQALFDLIAQALTAPAGDKSPGHKKKNGLNLDAISKGLEVLMKAKR